MAEYDWLPPSTTPTPTPTGGDLMTVRLSEAFFTKRVFFHWAASQPRFDFPFVLLVLNFLNCLCTIMCTFNLSFPFDNFKTGNKRKLWFSFCVGCLIFQLYAGWNIFQKKTLTQKKNSLSKIKRSRFQWFVYICFSITILLQFQGALCHNA